MDQRSFSLSPNGSGLSPRQIRSRTDRWCDIPSDMERQKVNSLAGKSTPTKLFNSNGIIRPCKPRSRKRLSINSIQNKLERHDVTKLSRRCLGINSLGLFQFENDVNMEHLKYRKYQMKSIVQTSDYCPMDNSEFLFSHDKVIEIISSQDFVFCLTQSGNCLVFDRLTLNFIHKINEGNEEIVRSLFLNRLDQSLITVSVHKEDNFSSLRCKSIPLESIKARKFSEGTFIFTSEALRWPGFVEFDDVNGKVLTYSSATSHYKVWSLRDYSELYMLDDPNIEEIKISFGVMLVIFKKQKFVTYSSLPLKLLQIDTGLVLKEFKQILKRCRKVEFIEQFNEKLLIKQEMEDLNIFDISTGELIRVPNTVFVTPSAFIFLYELRLFLTFRDRDVLIWNFSGECVTRFDDHTLMYQECNTNNIYITMAQDVIISYCRDTLQECGAVHISHIGTGKLIEKISASSFEAGSPESEILDDVNSLFYNEEFNEIYLGSCDGHLSRWAHH